jgi:hypothetical protein
LRLANADYIGFRNAANSGDLTLGPDTNNVLQWSGSGSGGIQANYFKSFTSNPSSSGQLRFAAANFLGFRNLANDADITLGLDGTSSNNFLANTGLQLQTATPNLFLSATSAFGSSGQSLIQWADTHGSQATFGFDNHHDNRMRLSFSSTFSSGKGAEHLQFNQSDFGDFWDLNIKTVSGTGDTTSGSAVITNVSASIISQIQVGDVVWVGSPIADNIASIVDGTHFTVVTGGAYPTGGGKITDQDTGVTLTYSAYNSGTKTFTVASTTGLLAGDSTYCAKGIPPNAAIITLGATSITIDQNCNSTTTGLTILITNPESGCLTMATPGSRCGTDLGLLSLYQATSTSNRTSGMLYLHNNDPFHTPGRVCGITFFNDAALDTRGVGPAGCPIGGLNFFVENDNYGPIGTGNFSLYVGNGTTYYDAILGDHSGNLTLSHSTGGVNFPFITAGQVLVSDGSKNLTSAVYGSTNVVNSFVQRDSSGSFTANIVNGAVFASTSANSASSGAVRLANADSIFFRNAANSGDLTLGPDTSNVLLYSGLGSSGFQAAFFRSTTATPATAGQVRLAADDLIEWRNSGNSGQNTLGTTSDLLKYNSVEIPTISSTSTLTNKTLTGNTAANLISGSGTLTLNTSGTVTVPNATDTLVGKATNDTLTNKTLTGNTAANLISGSGTLTLNTSGTITVPNGTDTLVGKATSDTLTNKTLTSPVISTIVNTGTLTLPTSTDTLVGRATTDTLTNKSIDAGQLTGTIAAGRMPALTGDVTSSAGAVATTVAKIAGTTVSGTTGTTNVMFSASPTTTGTLTGAAANFSGTVTRTNAYYSQQALLNSNPGTSSTSLASFTQTGLPFTPPVTAIYRITANVSVYGNASAIGQNVIIALRETTGTVASVQAYGDAYFLLDTTNFPTYVQPFYDVTLTGGVAYVFKIQGQTAAGTINLDSSHTANGIYITAQQLN